MAGEPSRPAVFGMACTYETADLQPFVLSLRSSGYEGTVRLGIDPGKDTANFLLEQEVTATADPCSELADLQPKKVQGNTHLGNLNTKRWSYYKKWLIEGRHDRVWLTDVRDVIFQANPFVGLSNEITFFISRPELTSQLKTATKKCFGEDTNTKMKAVKKMPTLDSGVVEGNAAQVLALCSSITKMSQQVGSGGEGCAQNDQYLLTYYAFENDLTQAGRVVFPGRAIAHRWNGTQAVSLNATECAGDSWAQHVNSEGLVVDGEGSPIPVIHRWDKCEALSEAINTKYRPRPEPEAIGAAAAEDADLVAEIHQRKELVAGIGGLLILLCLCLLYSLCRRRKSADYTAVAAQEEEEEDPMNGGESDEEAPSRAPGEIYPGANARIVGRKDLKGQTCQVVRADPARSEVWVVRTQNGELHALRASNLKVEPTDGQESSIVPVPTRYGDDGEDSDCN